MHTREDLHALAVCESSDFSLDLTRAIESCLRGYFSKRMKISELCVFIRILVGFVENIHRN